MAGAWRDFAACRGAGPTIFFPVTETAAATAAAAAVCDGCAARDACLAFALATRQDHGIWGGMPTEERKKMRARANRALREGLG